MLNKKNQPVNMFKIFSDIKSNPTSITSPVLAEVVCTNHHPSCVNTNPNIRTHNCDFVLLQGLAYSPYRTDEPPLVLSIYQILTYCYIMNLYHKSLNQR